MNNSVSLFKMVLIDINQETFYYENFGDWRSGFYWFKFCLL